MTGYIPVDKDEVIGINTDNTDADLTEFLRKLVDSYLEIPWKNTQCGYACSDHASWTKAGYASSFVFEADFKDSSPYIHTTNDDVSHVSFSHIGQFSRLSIAYAIEMSLAK